MTILEELIHERVRQQTAFTISAATEKVAEEMARDILKDPAFRAEMHAVIRAAFRDTVTALTRKRRPRAAPRRRHGRGGAQG